MVQLRVLSITAHHLLSFAGTVPDGRVRAQERRVPAATVRPRPPARCRGRGSAEHVERPVEDRVARSAGGSPARRPRRRASGPTSWIQRLSGVSHLAIVRRNAPPSPVSSCHCWTVPLPNDVLADERGPAGVLQRPGDDLARRRAAAVDEARRRWIAGSVATPPPSASVAICVAVRRPARRRSDPSR